MKRILALAPALLLLAYLATLPAFGQEEAVRLNSREVRSQFPEGVLFQAVAETVPPEKIQEIKLEMSIKGSSRSSYAFLEFPPDTRVQGTYLLRTGGAQHKPPGTLIEYRFVIKDSAGRTLETRRETFLYMDNRFEWEKIAEGVVEVYYYGPIKGRAELILKASTDTVARMGALLGATPEQPIRVIGYNNAAHMAPALPFQSKAVQAQLQTQGQAWYDYGVLLVLAGDPRADGVAAHELTHMLVGEAVKGALVDLPLWLNEGLAEYGNVNPGYSFDEALTEAIASGKLLRLRHIQSMPGIPRDIILFYGQARSVVKYLIDTHGGPKMKELFAAFRQGLPIDEALKKVYGFDQDGLDNAWRKSLGLPPLELAPVSPAPAKEEPTPKEPAKASRWELSCAPRTRPG